jgi:hydrogenase maturation factor
VSSKPDPDAGHRPEPHCDPGGECITCGDVGVPMRVTGIDRDRELALCVDHEGHRSTVEIALVAPVALQDELLVHAGTAIARLDQEALPA